MEIKISDPNKLSQSELKSLKEGKETKCEWKRFSVKSEETVLSACMGKVVSTGVGRVKRIPFLLTFLKPGW